MSWNVQCHKLVAMVPTHKQQATLDALGVWVVEMKVSAANDNARDAKVRGLDTVEYKRGGVTRWRRAAAVGSGVGQTAEGNDAFGEVAGFAAIAAALPAVLMLASLVLVLEEITLR